MSAQTELDELLLATTTPGPEKEEDVFRAAQGVWEQLYGAPRIAHGPRLRGCRRQAPAKKGFLVTLQEFMKRRRAEVQKLGGVDPVPHPEPGPLAAEAKALSGGAWGATHQKEEDRQTGQMRLRRLEAAHQGCLPGNVDSPALEDYRATLDTRRNARVRVEQAVVDRLTRPTYDLKFMRVYCPDSSLPRARLLRLMHQWHFRVVVDVCEAGMHALVLDKTQLICTSFSIVCVCVCGALGGWVDECVWGMCVCVCPRVRRTSSSLRT